MCAQAHNPEQPKDNLADLPATTPQEQQESPTSAPTTRPRPTVHAGKAGRNLVVRGVRRDPPDIRKLARVVASLAAAMAEAATTEEPPRAEPNTSDPSSRYRRAA
jgi:hypothetical protein